MRDSRPNILFIMSDDHGANAISLYGSRLSTVFKTPNLDRIGLDGAIFKNCYCTNSICTPSRASILTGQYPHVTGVRTLQDRLDESINTFPKILKKSGYNTAVIGKWHLHSRPQGFDHFDILPEQGEYFNPYFVNKNTDWVQVENYLSQQADWSKVGNYGDIGDQHEGYVTDIITDKCLKWLGERDQAKPFLLMCHHKAPHDNFEYHPRDEHLLDGVDIPEPDSLWEDKGHRSEGSRNYGSSLSERNPIRNAVQTMSQPDYPTGPIDLTGLDEAGRTKAVYQKYLKDYLRTVKAVDDNVGRVLDLLESEGTLDNTLVIYTSDQGMFLGEHDYIDKRWSFEESLQMPMMMRYPEKIPSGTVVDLVVSNVDFAPTILDFLGIPQPESMQGLSFKPIAQGVEMNEWSDEVYFRYWMHLAHHDTPAHYGVRTAEYKLTFFYGLPLDAKGAMKKKTPSTWELYDLRRDPFEVNNVYSNPEYKDIVASLKERLRLLKEKVGDADSDYQELCDLLVETE
uniref:sulfatase family protein n=1 Tax=Marinobacterium profundum TaxID=1714300 RepID=UPI0008329173|nr:sulfatase [Marinobacterium profundum]